MLTFNHFKWGILILYIFSLMGSEGNIIFIEGNYKWISSYVL